MTRFEHSATPSRRTGPSRRSFLRALGTLGIALPFLEGLEERSAWAQVEGPPAFGFFIVTACGVAQAFRNEPERFWPAQELGALTTEGMQSYAEERATGMLAPYADKLQVVRGVNYPFPNRGCGHALGLAISLTASQPEGDAQNAVATGVSADTVIAQALNGPGVEPLTLYSGQKGGYIEEKLSFRAPGEVRAAEGNPFNVYQRLAGLSLADGDAAVRLIGRRQSVNDLIRAELNSLKNLPALSLEDRQRVDLHFQSVRDIERNMVDLAFACTADGLDLQAIEALGSGRAFRQNGVIEDVAKLQIDLAAFAFACNASRVATMQVGDGTDGTRYTIDGELLERFHWISHRQTSDGNNGDPIANAAQMHANIDRLRMGTFQHLFDRFSQYSTGQGTLLDSSFAMWSSHVSIGPSHSFNNLPILVAGGANGFLRTGQYIDAGGAGVNQLLNTLINANGMRNADGSLVDNFGAEGLEGGLINEMVAAS